VTRIRFLAEAKGNPEREPESRATRHAHLPLCILGLRESLITLAAVEQMPAHRGTSLRDCAAANGVYDGAVFVLKYPAVGAPW